MQITRLLMFIIDLVLGVIIVGLLLRFFLRLVGANPFASFVAWIYDATAPLVSPFAGIFPMPSLDGTFAIEFATLFAILVYAILHYILSAAVAYLGEATRHAP